jgi:solute carrier family 45, member 1/2/4
MQIIGLYVMNFAINVMQGPGRSLIPDLVPEQQQDFANSMCSFMMGVANLVACYLGSIDISSSMPIFPSNFFAMFAIGLLFLIFGVMPTLLFAKEAKQDPSKIPPKTNVFKSIYAAAKVIPPKLLRACIVYFFAWMGFFPFQICMFLYFHSAKFGGRGGGPLSFISIHFSLFSKNIVHFLS